MNVKLLFVVNAVLDLLAGVALVLIPGLATSLMGWQIGPVGLGLARLLGAGLIALGFLLLALRKVTDAGVLRAALRGLFIGNLVALLLTLLGQVFMLLDPALVALVQKPIGPMPVGNVQALVLLVLFLLLTLGYGLLAFKRSAKVAGKPELSKSGV